MIVCVTGTGTEIGKTISTAALAAGAKAVGIDVLVTKPVQTGEPDGHGDAPTITRLTGVEAKEMQRFPEPLAPNLSARRANVPVPALADVAAWLRRLDAPHRLIFVEGAGGLLVRWADDYTIADVAAACSAPLIIVTALGLGSLNEAELTVNEARRRGLNILGLIGGSLPGEDTLDLATKLNVQELPVVTGCPLLGCIPAGSGLLNREEFTTTALRATTAIDFPAMLQGKNSVVREG